MARAGSIGTLKKNDSFVRTLTALQELLGKSLDLPIYDVEGLRLAKAWRISHLPALALKRGPRLHIVMGERGKPEDLDRCEK